jgi:hypothetical protein
MLISGLGQCHRNLVDAVQEDSMRRPFVLALVAVLASAVIAPEARSSHQTLGSFGNALQGSHEGKVVKAIAEWIKER